MDPDFVKWLIQLVSAVVGCIAVIQAGRRRGWI